MSTPLFDAPHDLVAVTHADVEDLTRRGGEPTVVHRFGDVAIIRADSARMRPGRAEVQALRELADPASLPRDQLIANLDLATFAYRRSGELRRRATGTVNMMSAVSGEAAAGDLP
ncbi:hypothetical protein [Serinicoccus kebangsaanensis]|uniref:hypothetical protein n=1 Tax=Serinicoccus kebangsaanensis TaxID=2602069 RepID=UPI00124F294F|nr:hypothetical protein [Serinicoccus kebangsaanensis]